ncbi:MAG TPA: TonB-dependent receptor plug domain-containing protein, partial [Paludibacteraceae bacterium]|nr:TonB-dependent receptor plug domain-containing protein [Paludibacteraceae bacterium]
MQKHKIRVRHIALMLGMLLLSTNIVAQQRTISGTVTDQNGDPVIGATVIVKEGTQGTVTNVDGKYTLGVPATARTLIFRSVGKINKEVDIAGSVVNVVLEDLLKTLDEVVVIGYGTQRKRDLTGSISSVSEKALKDIPVATVAEALTGKLPGVQVTTTEGSPDAEIKIRVRGGGSITQSNSPLYIVDGFLKDDIKDVAPSEIQSIDVLKDASSTAIYGSRGANGVIIITTKSAKQGKISLSYDGYVGFKNITKKLEVLSPYQFVQKQYERATWNNAVASEYEKYFGSYEDINLY